MQQSMSHREYYSLARARDALRDPSTRERVNSILQKEGLAFYEVASFKIIHLINFLHLPSVFPLLVQAIRIKIPVRVALQLPCMAFWPPGTYSDMDISEKNYHNILQPLGIFVRDYIYDRTCCGGTMLAFEQSIGKEMGLLRYRALDQTEVDFILTACPNCHVVYSVFPGIVTPPDGIPQPNVPPAIFFTQLLGLALGLSFKKLGLEIHRDRERIFKILEKWFSEKK
jgi:heterodisulfide reductase subunit B